MCWFTAACRALRTDVVYANFDGRPGDEQITSVVMWQDEQCAMASASAITEAALPTPEQRIARAGSGLARLLALKGCGWGEGWTCVPVHGGDAERRAARPRRRYGWHDLSPETTRQRVLTFTRIYAVNFLTEPRNLKPIPLPWTTKLLWSCENYLC